MELTRGDAGTRRGAGKSCARAAQPAQERTSQEAKPEAFAPFTAPLLSASLRLCALLLFFGTASPAWCSWGFAAPGDRGLLANLNAGQSAWLINALGVLTVLISIAVGVQKLRGDKDAERKAIIQQTIAAITAHLSEKHEMHLGGQPIAGTVVHPLVEHPTFDKHVDEIWKVVNGLRMAVSRIEKGLGENNVLREANGDRLAEVAAKVDAVSDAVNRLIGRLEARKS